MAGAPAKPAWTPQRASQIALQPYPIRARSMQTLTPAQRTQVNNIIANNNRNYMNHTIPKWAPVPAAGSALTQAWAAGAQLTFNVPTAQNAYVEGYFMRFVGTVTPATGTAAAYAKTAGAPLNLIDNVQVIYGNVVHNYRPYILRTLAMLQGESAPPQPSTVLVGQSVTTVSNYVNSTQPISVGSANTWDFELYVPLNLETPNDWRGLLPAMGGETQLQIVITCASTAQVGPDPILNVLSLVSGTGHQVTVAANFSVFTRYRDGMQRSNPKLMRLDVAGQNSIVFIRDQILTSFAAGSIYRGAIGLRSGHIPWVLLTIVDANQSNKFTAISNLQVIQETADMVGNSPLWMLGTGTNMSILEWFFDLRRVLLQDVDEGVWPIITGPIKNTRNPDNMDGAGALSTLPGGYPDWHYGFQLGSIGGVANIVPRVETHLIARSGALRFA